MLHERILRASIAAAYTGRVDDVIVKCNSRQKSALEYSIIATENLRRTLKNEDASLDEVVDALKEHKLASENFFVEFNVTWPL